MDDISEKISALLSSEDGMAKLKEAANSLFGAASAAEDTNQSPDLSTLMQAAKSMAAGSNDNRVKLLLALKPHLSEERAKRVDKAVKILQLAALAPLLTQNGIL